MATKNLVPRADNEGNIGLSTKKWAGAHFTNGTFDEIKVRSLKASDDTNIIIADSASNISVTTNTAGQYIIGGGSGSSAEADKIVKNDTSVTAIDNDGNDSKIELKVDDTLYWTFENDGDFIPTDNPDIGSSTNKVQKLFVNSGNDSGIEIGDSLIKFDTANNKLQLQHKQSNPNATQLSNIITSAELTSTLSGYLQAEADTLDSVVERNASTARAATFNSVSIGNDPNTITDLKTIVTPIDSNLDFSVRTSDATHKINFKWNSSTILTSFSKGKIEIVSDQSNPANIDFYATNNTNKTNLKASDVTSDVNLTLPSQSGTLALKSEVDAMASGIKVQKTVKAATTDSFTMASQATNSTLVLADGEGGFDAGADSYTVDGVSLVENNRVLIKDGVNSNNTGVLNKWNGIYTVGVLTGATLTLTRADDFNSGDSVSGFFMFVEQGTSNGDQGFVCTNDSDPNANPRPDDPNGTTPIEFSQFTAAGQITAGDGLSKSGDTLNIDADQSTTITSVGNLTSLTVDGTSTLKNNVTLENKKGIIFKELTSNGSESITLSAPDSLGSSYALQLPTALPSTSGYVLSSSDQGVLSWIDSTSGNGIQSVQEDENPILGGSLQTGNYFIDGDLVPITNNSKNLGKIVGDNEYNWQNLYLSGKIFLAPDYQISHDNGYITLKKDNDSTRFKLESSALTTTPNELILNFKNNQSAARTINKIDFDHNDITSSSIELDSTSNAFGYKFKLKTLGKNDDGDNTLDDRILIDTSNASRALHKIELSLPLEIKASRNQSSSIKLFEKSQNNGSNYVQIKAPDLIDQNNSYTITLPAADGTTNQILKRNSNGDLEWSDQSSFNLKDVNDQKTSLVQNDKFLIADSQDNLTNKKVNFSVIKDKIFDGYAQNQPVVLDYNPGSDTITSTISNNSVSLDKISAIGSMKVLGNLGEAEANVTEVTVSKSEALGGDNPSDDVLATQKAIKAYVDARIINTSSSPTSALEFDIENFHPIGQTLSTDPDDNTKQYYFYNNEQGFAFNDIELDLSVIGQEIKIVINTQNDHNITYKTYDNDLGTTNEQSYDALNDASPAQQNLKIQEFTKALTTAYNYKYFVSRINYDDYDSGSGWNAITAIDRAAFTENLFARLSYFAHGTPKLETLFPGYGSSGLYRPFSKKISDGGLLENDRRDCSQIFINSGRKFYLGGGDQDLKLYGGGFNVANYMSPYSDVDQRTQFKGLPTVFLPTLNESFSFDAENDLIGQSFVITITNESTNKQNAYPIITKSKLNGNSIVPCQINSTKTRDFKFAWRQYIGYEETNIYAPYGDERFKFYSPERKISNTRGRQANQFIHTYINDFDRNLNTYDGAIINGHNNNLKPSNFCDWANYFDMQGLKYGETKKFKFTIGKRRFNTFQDWPFNASYIPNPFGPMPDFRLYTWQVEEI